MKKLHEWTEEEYTKLKASGFLFEFYPEATGEWGKDGKKELQTPLIGPEDVNVALCNHSAGICDGIRCKDCTFNYTEATLEWARGL